MKKKICRLFLGILFIISLAGCRTDKKTASADTEPQKVELVVWGAEEDTELMNQIIQKFKVKYGNQADFQITFEVQGESNCKDVLIGGLEEGADVFTFADDQLHALAAAGALDPIENEDKIKADNLPSAVEAASVNGSLYAYPLTDTSYITTSSIFRMNRLRQWMEYYKRQRQTANYSQWTGLPHGMYILSLEIQA